MNKPLNTSKPNPVLKEKVRTYALLQFETFQEAKQNIDKVRASLLASGCDQLNIAIREEGNMDDPELLGIDPRVKIFAGVAWFLIHERRVQDGWYP